MISLRTVTASRYVTPLREGGSLPAIIEADDDGLYVLKFRGAGQGAKALIAELVAGEIGRLAGLPVPEIVFVELPPDLARTEPDAEIQSLIHASAGLNLALDYLPGSVTFDPLVYQPEAKLASSVVWFDALVCNVDRTARNVNMLMWHRRLWLIDHGAALYFHHAWNRHSNESAAPFALIKDHVLLKYAGVIEDVDAEMTARLDLEKIAAIVELIPDAWLADDPGFAGKSQQRKAYLNYFAHRLKNSQVFVREAINARNSNL
ncbi:MAG TPA: HipA family kinase [Steroidobacteraceae bacterium]